MANLQSQKPDQYNYESHLNQAARIGAEAEAFSQKGMIKEAVNSYVQASQNAYEAIAKYKQLPEHLKDQLTLEYMEATAKDYTKSMKLAEYRQKQGTKMVDQQIQQLLRQEREYKSAVAKAKREGIDVSTIKKVPQNVQNSQENNVRSEYVKLMQQQILLVRAETIKEMQFSSMKIINDLVKHCRNIINGMQQDIEQMKKALKNQDSQQKNQESLNESIMMAANQREPVQSNMNFLAIFGDRQQLIQNTNQIKETHESINQIKLRTNLYIQELTTCTNKALKDFQIKLEKPFQEEVVGKQADLTLSQLYDLGTTEFGHTYDVIPKLFDHNQVELCKRVRSNHQLHNDLQNSVVINQSGFINRPSSAPNARPGSFDPQKMNEGIMDINQIKQKQQQDKLKKDNQNLMTSIKQQEEKIHKYQKELKKARTIIDQLQKNKTQELQKQQQQQMK